MSVQQKIWLFSPKIDVMLFLGSSLISLGIVGMFWAFGLLNQSVGFVPWLIFVVGIDVSHVYSTIFRTYLLPGELKRKWPLYTILPVTCFLASLFFYSVVGARTFWISMAYVALIHFIRQQQGFLRLYHRKMSLLKSFERYLDEALIILSCLFPVAYWHAHGRSFAWFVEGDFNQGFPQWISDVFGLSYLCLALIYIVVNIVKYVQTKVVYWGKHLLILATAISWGVGIVLLDSDLAFTVTNVILHGVPYLYLNYRVSQKLGAPKWFANLKMLTIPVFLLLLLGLALLEEGLWDRLINHEYSFFFGSSIALPHFLVPFFTALLFTPQLTHYVLDGFIWRKGSHPSLGKVFS